MTTTSILVGLGGSGYKVSNSLRFRSSASAYLNRTLGSNSTSNTTATFSTWIKRGTLGTIQRIYSATNAAYTGNGLLINFSAGDAIQVNEVSSGASTITTNAVFRDPSAWYHIVVSINTVAGTLNIYVNGVQQTTTGSPLSGSAAFAWGSGNPFRIGADTFSGLYYLDAYLAETYWIDGQALAASSFGAYDTNGVWQPAKYSGTYGTNGFYLTFGNTTSTATLGNDSSGNGNTWTVNNVSLTAGSTYDSMTDSPTVSSATVANYAVMNPLNKGTNQTIANGNLTNTASAHGTVLASIGVTSGFWYGESTLTVTGAGGIGFTSNPAAESAYNNVAGKWWCYDNGTNFVIQNGVSGTSYSTRFAAGQVWQWAIDNVNGRVWIGVNNAWLNSTNGTTGSPSTGANPTFTFTPGTLIWPFLENAGGPTWNANFGQQPFTYTPPTGFVGLNTYSLPTPTIPAGAPYMNAIAYTGTSNLVPTGLGQVTKRNAGSRLVSNSLRFRSSATATLTRTPSVVGNRQRWTWSGWVKLGALSATQVLFGAGQNATTGIDFGFQSTNTFFYSINAVGTFQTTSIYRDPSAWYHVVFAFDSTQATQANRSIVYVNGVNIPFSTNGVVQNNNYDVNNTIVQYFGQSGVSTQYLDGYLAEVNFVDGQALTPSSFATTNSDGIWVPAAYGGTYGTNGFYLPFTQSGSFSYAALTPSGYVNAPTSTAFAVGTNAYTMEAWFYPINTSFTGSYFSIAPNGLQMGFQNSTSWGVAQANVAWELTTTSMPTVGQWNHMAIVRSGTGTNQTALFLNGTRVALGTVATSYAQNSCFVGSSNTNGYISNARLVNGTAIYSPASTTITVPTTPLTNVTNTSLLTFQNATAVDNSSNAFTLTTTGTMPISGAYPFALLGTGIANDASGNGNNWTANNISTIQNTTYDTMIDSPTDYASASDYAVLNPLYNVSSEASYMSNGNLQITDNSGNSVWHQTRSTVPTVAGSKWYWEITLTTLSGGIANYTGVDLVTDATNPPSGGAYQLYWNTANYAKTTNSGTNTNFTGTPTVNDVIQVAYDAVNGQIWFGKNGTYFEGNPSAGTGASYTGINTNSTAFVASYSTTSATSAFAVNFGQRPFAYTPPTGFIGVNTYNLPTPTTSWFTTANNTVAGNTTAYPDLVWVKARSSAQNHSLTDTVRGPTLNLIANTTGVEAGLSTLFAVNKYGLTLGNDVSVNSGSVTDIMWGWQAGQNTTASNTNGSITSTVSANTTAGFSIVSYTGNTTAGATVGHGLGVAPSMIIIKSRTNGTDGWVIYHVSVGNTKAMFFDTTTGTTNVVYWNNTSPSSTVFTLGSGTGANNTTPNIAYCWAAVPGFSSFGSYTGNGSTDGPFLYTGFKPRFIMFKNTSLTANWGIWDTTLNPYNVASTNLLPNASSTTNTGNGSFDFLSNGVKVRALVANETNVSGSVYLYAAFAENPFNFSRAS